MCSGPTHLEAGAASCRTALDPDTNARCATSKSPTTKFNCQADGNNCGHLVTQDTSFTGNTLNVKGSALGIRAEGPLPQSLTIKNNTLSMGTGTGIMIASLRVDGSTVTGNTITGSGAHAI